MFKIGDEVMDKDGNSYTVIAIKEGRTKDYELIGLEGMPIIINESLLAKYEPRVAEAFSTIADKIRSLQETLTETRQKQSTLFEEFRRI